MREQSIILSGWGTVAVIVWIRYLPLDPLTWPGGRVMWKLWLPVDLWRPGYVDANTEKGLVVPASTGLWTDQRLEHAIACERWRA